MGMRSTTVSSFAFTFTFTLMLAGVSSAQQPAPGPPNQPPPAEPGQPLPAQPAPVPAQVPTDTQPQPALSPASEPTTAAPTEPSPAEPEKPAATGAQATGSGDIPLSEPALRPVPAEPGSGDEKPWYEALDFAVFADGYFSLNYNFPKPQANANAVVRAYDTSNGFALSWVGFDVAYPAAPVGGTVSLRFGPSAERLARGCLSSPCDSELGLSPVKQAFASWKPGGADSSVQLDFGKFDTLYGAEVADSQGNINYTRGLLYWFAQPAFHTGLRLGADFSESFTLKAMLVNGINNTVDNNLGKTLGLQGVLNLKRADGPLGAIALGYMVGPERDDVTLIECPAGQSFNPDVAFGCVDDATSPGESGLVDRPSTNTEGLRHLIDLVVTLTPTDELSLVFNGDFGTERLRSELDPTQFEASSWYGVMLGARYGISDMFAVGGRGEYLGDPEGHVTGFTPNKIDLVSATLTLDFLPADYLLVRLDNRLDWSSKQLFLSGVRDATGSMFTTTLGVVATTN
jgi:hypothetical protein